MLLSNHIQFFSKQEFAINILIDNDYTINLIFSKIKNRIKELISKFTANKSELQTEI